MSDLLIRNVTDELKITLEKLQAESVFETQNSFLLNVLEDYVVKSFQNNKSLLFINSENNLINALSENTEALNKLLVVIAGEDEVI